MLNRLNEMKDKYQQISDLLCQPEIATNLEEFTKLAKARASLEDTVKLFKTYEETVKEEEDTEMLLKEETDESMADYLKQELEKLNLKKEKLFSELTLKLLPKDPRDSKNIIMEIRAGTGGEEAGLFVGDLYRMYMHFAENNRWKVEVLSINSTELGGFKEVIIGVTGKMVYSQLKFESGVHRVQRVPATEASGRIHTSAATVAVLPEADTVEISINPVDLRIDTYRSSGAGGQHVNKTDSAVRITHLPTGIVVAYQDERSQFQNKDKAMRLLRAHILQQKEEEQQKQISQDRRQQVGTGERSEKIRTYNFPQGRVTDHRIGMTLYKLEAVLNGDIEDFIQALIEWEQKKKLAELAI